MFLIHNKCVFFDFVRLFDVIISMGLLYIVCWEVTGRTTLRSKGQTSRSLGPGMRTLFSAHIFVKKVSIRVNPRRPGWSTFHAACVVKYNIQWKCVLFEITERQCLKQYSIGCAVSEDGSCAVNHDRWPCWLYTRRYSADSCGRLCGRRCSKSSNSRLALLWQWFWCQIQLALLTYLLTYSR